ncbi:alpha/beta fold hydrolase [Coleofasciculus sp. E2-BRE-01]|uniref:alpha/beta fold hydrolase n=1 Tax=Coleofasciculus sp. E2-BRE-01 TaxID=3069524 RepID=UPI004064A4AD
MQVPTLVVRGGKDPLVPPYWAEEVVELLPQAQLAVIPGGGHTLNYSAPLELSRVTKAFLEATKSQMVTQEI